VAAAKRKAKNNVSLKFNERLILNQYMLSLLEVKSLESLAKAMNGPEMEGLDEDNVSGFYRYLAQRLFERQNLSNDTLLQYDQNIIRHTLAISEKRDRPVVWKYFQYLSLLFTEMYLDRYFRDPKALLEGLNERVQMFNADKSKKDRVDEYILSDLRKLAFWNATGSGKTLIMHVNILQYLHYLRLYSREKELNRIILLTPNEGLSNQHHDEFKLSSLNSRLFRKDGWGGADFSNVVDIIDIHKLREDSGEKTVAVDSFEGNNLVLVDEGHRGSSGLEWKARRDKLCEQGFSFEYSATFGQAMKAAKNRDLEQEYAKCILFDYSYRYFYNDGYGKDYRIFNLVDDSNEDIRRLYLVAGLLSFYQQQRLFEDQKQSFAPFLLEKPLMVFVGGSVTKSASKKDKTDTIDILLFLADFVKDEKKSIQMLDRLISGRPGLLDEKEREIFANSFTYLIERRISGKELFNDILRVVFNTPVSGGLLHVENLKGIDGEVGLRVGDSELFGVINIGEDAAFCRLCEKYPQLVVTDREFSESLFKGINDKDSSINVLIGSRKFTEGWNSWRVSTMGLMNIGRTEGTQIIQLFGRGVRLKGYGYSLKRSKCMDLPKSKIPENIQLLETLNVFGVRADYMQQFREILKDEGLPIEQERIDFVLPVIKSLESKKLKTLRLREGLNFKKDGPKPTLDLPNEYLLKNKVVLNWYPKIQAMKSPSVTAGSEHVAILEEGRLTKNHIAFMNLDEIYFELQRYKNDRAWYNLNLPRTVIKQLLLMGDWYTLYIPPHELEFTSFDRVQQWEEIAILLLQKYCSRYYKHCKDEWEREYLEYHILDEYDTNVFEQYHFSVEESESDIIASLNQLKDLIADGTLNDFSFGNLEALCFSCHLYQPLVHFRGESIKVVPVHLNEGERDFVVDLRQFYKENTDFFSDKELYLLRNLTRGKGIGFFEAGNFYPDFIMWLLVEDRQYITFVDPKGIRNLQGMTDPKIAFYKTIKDVERRLGDPNMVLSSFIISRTPLRDVSWWGDGMTKEEFEGCHVLFPVEDGKVHIKKMIDMILSE
jgi:hypothetical protein